MRGRNRGNGGENDGRLKQTVKFTKEGAIDLGRIQNRMLLVKYPPEQILYPAFETL